MLCYQTRPTTRRTARGITQPVYASVRAILKQDGPESPYCVYNELVATRLADMMRLPIALGVPTESHGAIGYASLLAAASGGRLADLPRWRNGIAAYRYADEAAALVAFDVFIGNWDRGQNLKVALDTARPFFCAFDHSHALLAVRATPQDSIAGLRSHQLLVRHHPFYGLVSAPALGDWAQRIRDLPNKLVHAACCTGTAVNAVDPAMQQGLADALMYRKAFLGFILEKHQAGVLGP